MTDVTIITVAYNSEATIRKAIESVLAQTYPVLEYIIVDGASSDNTVSVAQSYQEQFRARGYTFRIVSEPDQGMYDALNKGIRMAGGELIGNINSDDWYELQAVEKMVEFYHREAYDIAWSSLRILKSNGQLIKKAHTGKLWTTAGFCHPTMFARKQILQQFPYALTYMDADFDMVTRAKAAGVKICVLDEVLANYRLGGMSTKKSFRDMLSRIKMKYATYRRNGYSPLYWFYCAAMEMAKFILG